MRFQRTSYCIRIEPPRKLWILTAPGRESALSKSDSIAEIRVRYRQEGKTLMKASYSFIAGCICIERLNGKKWSLFHEGTKAATLTISCMPTDTIAIKCRQ